VTEFTCSRCGKCCMSLGRHIRVVRSTPPRSFVIRVQVTGETLPVQVVPSLSPLFSRKDPPAWEPGWCPFLRKEGENLYTCTIHPFRPRICREFRCMTMCILDSSGRRWGGSRGGHRSFPGTPASHSSGMMPSHPWRAFPRVNFPAGAARSSSPTDTGSRYLTSEGEIIT